MIEVQILSDIKMSIFFCFGSAALISSLLVITSKNPIHSIFSLVLAFANVSILLILLGIEFLGLLFLIVYVGAIAILFLFVVMMLNIKLVELLDNTTRYIPIGILIGIIFLIELSLLLPTIDVQNTINYTDYFIILPFTNILLLAEYLYTDLYVYFLFASIILLVAMLAAIVLTLSHEINVKRQDLFVQINTDYTNTIKKC